MKRSMPAGPPEFEPAVPSGVWEQDQPVGGADVNGRIPPTAVPVLPVGIQTVRVVPSLVGMFGKVALVNGSPAQRIVGRLPQRRVITLIASSAGAGVVVISESQQQATSGYGMILPLNTPVPLPFAGDLWAAATGADSTLSFAQCVDQG